MKLGGQASRRVRLAGAATVSCLVAATACTRPIVGEPTRSSQLAGGPEIAVTGATAAADGRVTVTLALSQGGSPLSRDAALALKPTFTLAALSTHPVDGLRAWESLLLTGSQTAVQLRPAGPPTPSAQIVTGARQPGSESSGAFDGADGTFTYAFATLLPAGFPPSETLRVGVYLAAATGTRTTTATHDFRPDGGPAAPRDTVLAANCDRCHGMLRAHGGRRVGVKICLTCHTWQNSDPDTVDPAALDGATPATDPNPLELGRLVHRIHRGKNLPTLYQAAAGGTAVPAPALPSAAALPLPFFPGRNTPVAGRKFSVIGYQSRELVFGRVASRTDNTQPARAVAEGVAFPRDLRDCEVCHGGAPQEAETLFAVSRRTCNGCHPETWFGATPITDAVHFAHTGGPQPDEASCAGCHVTAAPPQKLYAPLAEIHVVPRRSPRHDRPTLTLLRVADLVPGGVPDGAGGTKGPTVVFKLQDRAGDLLRPDAPSPASDTWVPPSPVPRAFSSLAIRIAGPTTPDFSGAPVLNSGDPGNPSPLALVADATTHELAYTFTSALPAGAAGTWAVAIEGRRRATPVHYDPATDTFAWPFTGEQVTESPDNVIAYVDSASGAWSAGAPGAAVPRRTVVAQEKCERCHGRFELHGGQRHQVALCLLCHTPDRTDWGSALGAATVSGRPKVSPSGSVSLAGTFDGVEERSIHLKVLVHRIHTGGRAGAAALDLVEPHVVYGYGGNPYFFDDVEFPNDLRNCTVCHEGRTYAIEAVPADAPPTIANENPTVRHLPTTDGAGNVLAPASSVHVAGEPATPAVQAACLGCHATGAAVLHAAGHTVSGVEQCAGCHARGSLSVDVVHGLAAPAATSVEASFSSISQNVLVPRCASAACHGGSSPAYFPRLDAGAAWAAVVGVASRQAGLSLVEPFAPERSYLLLKLRGDAAAVGGIATTMPLGDVALDPAELAAIEAWIANGAPND